MQINWESLGVSEESNFVQLFFDPHSETLVAHFNKDIGKGYGLKSLWARHIDEPRYSKLTPTNGGLSYEYPVLSPLSAHVFTNVLEAQSRNNGYDGYDWHSVQRIDLLTGEIEELVKNGEIDVEPPFVKAWVSTLHGVSHDAKTLHCSITHQRSAGAEDADTDYYLSKYHMDESRFEPITKLAGTFL